METLIDKILNGSLTDAQIGAEVSRLQETNPVPESYVAPMRRWKEALEDE